MSIQNITCNNSKEYQPVRTEGIKKISSSSHTPSILKTIFLFTLIIQSSASMLARNSSSALECTSYLSHDFCPNDRYQSLQQEFDKLQERYGLYAEPGEDQNLIDFQEQVIKCINYNQANFNYKSGLHAHTLPILNDAEGNPVAAMKEPGLWLTTTDIGDVIAYKLDHQGFAGVKPAFQINEISEGIENIKHGNAVFVKWVAEANSITLSQLASSSHMEQRQSIAILDKRLGNKDRTKQNIIVDSEGSMFPIDHDLIFSSYRNPMHLFDCCADFPLTDRSKQYIKDLDINKDVEILKNMGVDQSAIDGVVIRTTFLKLAAESQFSLSGQEISFLDIQNVIHELPLSKNMIKNFINRWVYSNPLLKILNNLKQPYNETELKEAFRDLYNKYLMQVQTSHSLKTYYFFPEKLIHNTFCVIGSFFKKS